MDAGSDIVNIGTVDSTEARPETDTETVTITQTPGYTISKTVFDVAGDGPAGEADEAGDVITYEIVVTNTGNLSINGVVLADPLLEGAFGTLGAAVESLNPDGILDVPGETFTYTGIYTVQQSDIDNFGIDKDGLPDGNGFIDNTASVTSIEIPAAQESSAAVPVILPPASCELEISKSCCVLPPPSANGGTDCEGKVVEAIFMYTGDDCSATTNDQKGKLSCIGVIGGDPNINLFDPLFPNQFLEPVDVVLKGKGADKINISTEFGGTSLVVGERIAFSHVDSGKTLGSNTQFDLEGFYGTQSLKIHTSCSKPLNVGDQLGSMLLVQLTSTEGGTVTLPDGNELTACVTAGDPVGTACDSRLTEVVFEYTANGCEDPLANGQGGKASCEDFFTPLPDLADMTLVYTGKDPEKFTITQDDPNQPIFKLITTRKELHSDTKLEIRDSTGTVLLQKLKMHSSCSQPLSLGDVFGSLRVVEFSTKDGGQFLLPDPEPPAPTNLCTIELAPPGPHCTTKPTSLTFRFVAGDCSITNDQEGRASCIQHGDPLLETEIARIVVTGTKKNADRIYSDTADVAVGDIVTALASAGGSSKFGSSTMAKIYVNGLLRQEIEFHTSCSKELNLGDRFGGLEVFGIDRQEGGPISLGAMIEYEINITNPTASEVTGVIVTDDQLGVLASGETIAAGETLTLFERVLVTETTTNIVTVTADQFGQTACTADATVEVEDPPVEPPSADACAAGKPFELVFEYLGQSCDFSTTDQDGKFECVGFQSFNLPFPVQVVVTKNPEDVEILTTAYPTAEVVGFNFPDNLITFTATEDRLRSSLRLNIVKTGNVLQSLNIHTSCSAPLAVGDQFGALKLIEFTPQQ